ncbi:ABC transporter substrate-binding protein [soil metagenome]
MNDPSVQRFLHDRLDRIRHGRSELDNHVIDELKAGRLSRRDFIVRASVIGIAAPLAGQLLVACGGGGNNSDGTKTTGGSSGGAVKSNATLRAAVLAPTARIDPVLVNNPGGLVTIGQVGEYLAYAETDATLRPVLAEKWSPNATGDVWTFTIRKGVKFHDGTTMTAKDVVATFERLADPEVGSNALSALKGVLSKGGTESPDDTTVVFTLDAPNVNFPYLVSSQNYNSIILPAKADTAKFDEAMIATGPFMFKKYSEGVSADFVANPDYWDSSRMPKVAGVSIRYYEDLQPQILALQGKDVDAISQISYTGGRALFEDSGINVINVPSAFHREISMRVDKDPFTDKRVRQAFALLLDRPAEIKSLIGGKAVLGNDSPFAPLYPVTDKTVPQRKKDVAQAKQLLADAGQEGASFTITAIRSAEIPDLAVVLQNAAKEGGMDVKLEVLDSDTYYGEATFGNSPWLDSTVSICDYGHRSVPDVLLNAPLRSDGVWNAAHFKDPAYDKLVDQYSAELDLEARKGIAKKLQEKLLDETPIIIPYFLDWLAATLPNVEGVSPNPTGQLDLSQASITA